MTYIKTSEELPNAEPLKTCNAQYHVYVPGKGYFKAKYAFDEAGTKSWYNVYNNEIIEDVYAWGYLND